MREDHAHACLLSAYGSRQLSFPRLIVVLAAEGLHQRLTPRALMNSWLKKRRALGNGSREILEESQAHHSSLW